MLAFNLSYLFHREDLLAEGMARLIDAGVRAPKVTEYPFTDVARAHQDLEAGLTVGKLVLAF